MSKKSESKISINGLEIKPISKDVLVKLLGEPSPFSIISAVIKEEQCNYGYEIRTGPGAGDKIPTRKGSSIIHEDMQAAFDALAVHLAILDDGFKYTGTDATTLDEKIEHTVTSLFRIQGFKVTGTDDNEGFILMGEKFVEHGNISLESPKITVNIRYEYFDELSEAIGRCREEVLAYMNGKQSPAYEQTAMEFDALKTEDAAFDLPM